MSQFRILAAVAFMTLLSTRAQAQLLIPQEGELHPSFAEPNDHSGRSISLDAGSIVIGVRDDDDFCPSDPLCNSGSAYVFVKIGTGWVQQQKFNAVDAAAGDDFGESVAIWGDTVVIGAPGVDASGNNSGAIYVFTRSGSLWSPQGARLIPNEVAAEDCFGGSVGLEGDLIVAGARFHAVGAELTAGSAYVFTRTLTTWSQQAELVASDADQFDQFGTSVHAGTDRVVIGVPLDDAPDSNSGSAYVFSRTGTLWSQEAKLTASNGDAFDAFGNSVSMDGTQIVVGSPFRDRTSVTPGAAYVFDRAGTIWTEDAILMSIDLDGDDRFGHAVDIRAGTVVVGTPRDNHVGVTMGSTYVFEKTGTDWIQESKLTAFNGAFLDEFGQSVSTDGTSIAIGAWLDDDSAGTDEGSGYVFGIRRAVFEDFCYGDGGDQLGCRDCACGNNAKPGSLGGCLNSMGDSGRLSGFGVASLLTDTLRFEAVNCSPSTFGILLATDFRLPIAGICPPGSGITQFLLDGLRCAGQGLIRHGTRATDTEGSIGITNGGWGGSSPPPIGLIAQGGYIVGQTRHWQITYRDDPLLVCNTGLNTTNGVTVTMVP